MCECLLKVEVENGHCGAVAPRRINRPLSALEVALMEKKGRLRWLFYQALRIKDVPDENLGNVMHQLLASKAQLFVLHKFVLLHSLPALKLCLAFLHILVKI